MGGAGAPQWERGLGRGAGVDPINEGTLGRGRGPGVGLKQSGKRCRSSAQQRGGKPAPGSWQSVPAGACSFANSAFVFSSKAFSFAAGTGPSSAASGAGRGDRARSTGKVTAEGQRSPAHGELAVETDNRERAGGDHGADAKGSRAQDKDRRSQARTAGRTEGRWGGPRGPGEGDGEGDGGRAARPRTGTGGGRREGDPAPGIANWH